MLAARTAIPEELIGYIPPAGEPATVRTIAIHALMAGCKPEYLPVVIGAVGLIMREEFNLGGVQCTMHGVAPLLIVNGPYAQKIGIHGGNGCFGPGFRANATIGRAIRLLLLNVGDGITGGASATIFSSPIRYTACLAENTALSPWETSRCRTVMRADDNVISAVMVEAPRLHFDDVSTEPERLLRGIADSMTSTGSWHMWFASGIAVAMSPQHAGLCAGAGMRRADVHRRLCELAVRRQGDIRNARQLAAGTRARDGRRPGRRRVSCQGGEEPADAAVVRCRRARADYRRLSRLERFEPAGARPLRNLRRRE